MILSPWWNFPGSKGMISRLGKHTRRTMAAAKDLEVQKKRPVQSKEESTAPVNMFVPITDIFETEDALTVVVEMPGVEKGNVDISVKERILSIDGRLDFE